MARKGDRPTARTGAERIEDGSTPAIDRAVDELRGDAELRSPCENAEADGAVVAKHPPGRPDYGRGESQPAPSPGSTGRPGITAPYAAHAARPPP